MKDALLRLAALPVMLVLGMVLLTWVALLWLPAFVLFGDRGMDWVMETAERIASVPLGPLGRVLS